MDLYVVTRRDLSKEAQASQSCHVLMQFNCAFPEFGRQWWARPIHIEMRLVLTPYELNKLLESAKKKGVRAAGFVEPRLCNELTAVALDAVPAAKRLVTKLPVAE